MKEIQQSLLYADYIRHLGWKVMTVDHTNIFLKNFPFVGGIAKIHRPSTLPNIKRLCAVLREQKIRSVSVEPACTVNQKRFDKWMKKLSQYILINKTYFLPTKTIHISLTASEDQIFQHFSEAKRRAVRKAIKNNLKISPSLDIRDLIKIKNKSAGLFGFVTTSGVKELSQIFAPSHAAILLAQKNIGISCVVGGILLLFWQKTAYYWIAGATNDGKRLFAPTLLVWEAIKFAKRRGCTTFDFVGVWDERMPHKFHDWKGFTKFKEGFGGSPIYYPL
ncbi:peptidoglycan bridge formation glycyltransferase FemA/FemB family protein [Candidatus Gottesmanbacteria bacterium]|nr:peptidoglycan bridge formation glycyltransferase FemA/FemB family protein [Candidatus Gottesmanbacteria bacterium]